MKTIFTLLIALSLIGCTTTRRPSPGRNMTSSCDPCKVAKDATGAVDSTLQQASGGTEQTQQPDQRDVRATPFMGFTAGEGNVEQHDESQTKKRQLNAGNLSQGMLVYQPTSNEKRSAGAGPTIAEVGLLQSLRCTNRHLSAAVARDNAAQIEFFTAERRDINDRLEAIRASTAAQPPIAGPKFELSEGKSTNMGAAYNSADGSTQSDAEAKAKAEAFKKGTEEARKTAAGSGESSDDLPDPPADAPADDAPDTPGSGESGGE